MKKSTTIEVKNVTISKSEMINLLLITPLSNNFLERNTL